MKRRRQTQGNVLVTTLVITSLIGMVLVAYLMLAGSQNTFTMRSQVWASEIPIAEAGIEEAMAHLNTSATRDANGWALTAGQYVKQRTLGDGYFYVTISTSAAPVITSTGFARIPPQSAYSRRAVQVTATNLPWPFAILARDTIKMSGGSIIDSFNSADPYFSTGGEYDPAKANDNAKVGSTSTKIPAINTGTGRIYGSASTAPGGSASVGSSGGIGSRSWVTAQPGFIQPAHFTDDLNVVIPDNPVPFTTGYDIPGPGKVDGTNYTYVIKKGDYLLPSCSLSGGQNMIVTGTARLYVTGNFALSGSAYVYLKPGANFQLHLGGPKAAISGGGVVNGSLKASNFGLFGLPGLTDLAYSGSAQFVGTIHAPQAKFALSGSAGASGSFVVNSIDMSGGASLHYDEALNGGPPGRKFLITSWTEL